MMENATAPPCILLAEDDAEMRKTLSGVLRASGYQVVECADGLDLLKMFGASRIQAQCSRYYDLVISDIRMPGLSGMEFLEGFHGKEGFPPVILITAFGDTETHAKAKQLGAIAVFDKPFEVEDLLRLVCDAIGPAPCAYQEHLTNCRTIPSSVKP